MQNDHVTKSEFAGFKDEMYLFKDEMYSFRDEMYLFKDEMYSFRDEMYSFRDDMLSFKDDTNDRFIALRKHMDHKFLVQRKELNEDYERHTGMIFERFKDEIKLATEYLASIVSK